MTGGTRLPGGEPRKASQKRTRRGEAMPARITPQWRMGDRVRWQDKVGHFHRDLWRRERRSDDCQSRLSGQDR